MCEGFFSASGAAILSFCLSHTKYTPVWEVSCPNCRGHSPTPALRINTSTGSSFGLPTSSLPQAG